MLQHFFSSHFQCNVQNVCISKLMRFEKESLFLSFSIKGVVYLVMNRLTDNPNFGIGNVLNAKVNSGVFLISVANFNDISKYSPIYSRVLSNVGTYIIMYIAFVLGEKKKANHREGKNYSACSQSFYPHRFCSLVQILKTY